MDFSEPLEKHDQGDFLRAVAEAVLQLIMEADVEGLIGAGRHERAEGRTTWCNGYRERAFDTRLGTLNLKVPKLQQASYFPSFLEARKTSKKALVAVIQEAWIGGVSTRRVDELAQAMGLSGISKSTVSKLCKDIHCPAGHSAGMSREGTNGSASSSTARSPASGAICGSMPPIAKSVRAGASSALQR